ncbi:OLC1v1019852C2 [Oldenlandia corymbosa var. corymbosa]|nr:OLC1v1019852C2 [Oldenlandia corymbosa var. corymbosa]
MEGKLVQEFDNVFRQVAYSSREIVEAIAEAFKGGAVSRFSHSREDVMATCWQVFSANIISRLLDPVKQFRVVCISGGKGVANTTLAQVVYLDDSLRRHFDCIAWARVGDPWKDY